VALITFVFVKVKPLTLNKFLVLSFLISTLSVKEIEDKFSILESKVIEIVVDVSVSFVPLLVIVNVLCVGALCNLTLTAGRE
jgi:hypothetical protein